MKMVLVALIAGLLGVVIGAGGVVLALFWAVDCVAREEDKMMNDY